MPWVHVVDGSNLGLLNEDGDIGKHKTLKKAVKAMIKAIDGYVESFGLENADKLPAYIIDTKLCKVVIMLEFYDNMYHLNETIDEDAVPTAYFDGIEWWRVNYDPYTPRTFAEWDNGGRR